MNNRFCIYCHTLKSDGRKYIGITGQSPKKRWGYGYGYGAKTHIGAAIRKYGWDAFLHDILEDGLTEAEALQKEQEYIEKYETMNRYKGFNLTAGGEGVRRFKLSDEIKEKLRLSHLGKGQSDEQKRKRSESLKEFYRTHPHPKTPHSRIVAMIEARRGIEVWNKGKSWSDEVRQKLREANLGKKASSETREKMRNSASKRKVAVLDDNDNVIWRFDGIAEAARVLGCKQTSHITECCQGKRNRYMGYKWRYDD